MKQRLKRKKALMREREEQGLTTDDAVLEVLLNEQDRERGQDDQEMVIALIYIFSSVILILVTEVMNLNTLGHDVHLYNKKHAYCVVV